MAATGTFHLAVMVFRGGALGTNNGYFIPPEKEGREGNNKGEDGGERHRMEHFMRRMQ